MDCIKMVVTMNPCRCGYYPDLGKCTCTPFQVQEYQSRVSKPFLDRIDLCVEAAKIEYDELYQEKEEETSAAIRERVCKARRRQYERYGEKKTNAQLAASEVEVYCALDKEEKRFMKQIYSSLSLTVRTYHKVLKVARTIADLGASENIGLEHLREAVAYRTMGERKGY